MFKKLKNKKKNGHDTKEKERNLPWQELLSRLHRLISNILSKIVGLFWLSTAESLYFLVSLSTLSVLNEFLENDDFIMIITGNFSTCKKLPKNF